MKAKYAARRFLVVLIVLGCVGGAGWLAWGKLVQPYLEQGKADRTDVPPEEPDEQEAAPGAQPPPEPSSEPEQEPEPEPVSEDPLVGDWNLILVNSVRPLPEGFEVEELEIVSEYRVDARIAPDLLRMFAKAKEDGINLLICSGYRTVELQETNFENKKQEYMASGMSEEEAIATTATIIAVPGTSEHHTGLAVDIVTPDYQTLDEGFAETGAFRWLQANAADFGFVLRFPKDKEKLTGIIYEPWHYRYVGEEHARIMTDNGYCLEEYIYVLEQEQVESQKRLQAALNPEEAEEPESGEPEGDVPAEEDGE